MPTSEERILESLEIQPDGICDDCISNTAKVKPRQQVNTICGRLSKTGKIIRAKAFCSGCGKIKLINKILGASHVYENGTAVEISEGNRICEQTLEYQTINWTASERLDAIRRHIIKIMNRLDMKNREEITREQFSDKLTRLINASLIPSTIAIIIKMLNAMRNAAVYNDCQYGKDEKSLIESAFGIIEKWEMSLAQNK